MVETGHHQHPPAPAAAGHPPVPSMAVNRGPTWAPAEQLHHLQYCIHSNPSWHETVLLAFQQYIVMLGTTVLLANTLVPPMGGDPGDKARVIQTILFMSGINTLLQTLIGTRLPTVMGVSFAYVLPVLSIVRDYNNGQFDSEKMRFRHTMRTVQGSLIISSFVNIIMGYGQAWGNLIRIFSPIIVVPVVSVVSLGLFLRGFPLLANCVELGLPMLILLIITQQYIKHFVRISRVSTILERYALLVCLALIWAFAAILTVSGAYNNVPVATKQSCRTDRAFLISSAPWIRVPYPFQWGTPIFKASHVFGMFGSAIVASAESTGVFFAASRLAGATAPPAHVVSRSVGLQGIGVLLQGIFGSVTGNTASVENVGLLGLTRIGSRRVVQVSTGFMIFFSIFGKFGAFFASIPLPIFGGIYCILLGIVVAVGISFIQFTDTNSMRNMYVVGVSLFLSLSIAQYFYSNTTRAGYGPVRTAGGWFNDILNTIFASAPFVAIIVATVLDNTLEAKHAFNERGMSWWKPFQHRDGDTRNEEFYSMPLRINEYMPTRFL
ncbi:hypothetical protein CARUB_v10022938mg [Capsella rubella]|uniref:Nucleobase-ascorbate transporter 3 n=1 Tax=Capsella rubella TaxID=81985 RepID=R0HBM2_9BRAS|nr:nucleobase-ascorbate transporter 3 [Capsella rubella]EOA26844.1 hypothetical protein CARUB_v10022938mg [Capsella rubella]